MQQQQKIQNIVCLSSGSKYEDNIEELSGNGSLSSAISSRGAVAQPSGATATTATTARTVVRMNTNNCLSLSLLNNFLHIASNFILAT